MWPRSGGRSGTSSGRDADDIALRALGVTALYLGPVFESTAHGCDTVDYHAVDRRLGTDLTLRDLVARFHDVGIRVILALLRSDGPRLGLDPDRTGRSIISATLEFMKRNLAEPG